MLGVQRLRPARRRHDDGPQRRRCTVTQLGGRRGRASRRVASHTCAVLCERARAVLGRQQRRPARQRYGNHEPPAGVAGVANAVQITAGADGSPHLRGAVGRHGDGAGATTATASSATGRPRAAALPVPVSGLTRAVDVDPAGAIHTCAVLSDGTARCWGYGSHRQLGNGLTTQQHDAGGGHRPRRRHGPRRRLSPRLRAARGRLESSAGARAPTASSATRRQSSRPPRPLAVGFPCGGGHLAHVQRLRAHDLRGTGRHLRRHRGRLRRHARLRAGELPHVSSGSRLLVRARAGRHGALLGLRRPRRARRRHHRRRAMSRRP